MFPVSPLQNRNLLLLLLPLEVVDNGKILTQESRTRCTLNIYVVRAGMFISFLRAVATISTEVSFLIQYANPSHLLCLNVHQVPVRGVWR